MTSNQQRFSWFLVGTLGCLVMLRFCIAAPSTMDYWFFLAKGGRVWDMGFSALGGPNPFAFTTPPGSIFFDKEWLFELFLRMLWQYTGYSGTVLYRSLTILSWVVLFLWICRRLHADAWLSLLVFLTGMMTLLMPRMSVRPHVVGYIFLLLLFGMLVRPPKTIYLWITGLIFVAWANIHGSFVMGGALLGSYGAWALLAPILLKNRAPEQAERARQWRSWWYLLPLLPLLVCINPFGWKLWKVIWAFQREVSAVSDPMILPEWESFSLQSAYGLSFAILLTLTISTWFHRENRIYTERLGWIAVVALLGFSNMRFVGLGFLMLGPLLVSQLQPFLSGKGRPILFLLWGTSTLVSLWPAWHYAPPIRITPNLREEPEEVLSILDKHKQLSGHIYTNIHPTGYLSFRFPKRFKIAYDTHTITPGFAKWSQEYKRSMVDMRFWESYCHKYRCDLVLIDMKDQRMVLVAAHLQSHPQWKPIQMTLRWVLYARKDYAPQVLKPHHYNILRSFYTFSSTRYSDKTKVQYRRELQRLDAQPFGRPLADAIRAYATLRQHKLLPRSPLRKLTPQEQQKLRAILVTLKKSLQDAPWHPGIHYNLGLTLAALQLPKADSHLQQASRWNPFWMQPRLALLRYWWQQKKDKQVKKVQKDLMRLGRRGQQVLRWFHQHIQ